MNALSYRNQRNNKVGQTGEDIAMLLLRRLGLDMVEPVHTPWRIIRDHRGRIERVFPLEKVSGDFRAVGPGGQSVLAEVKVRDRNLRWTDFEPHQRQALTQHHELGGLSLIVWIHSSNSFIMAWPIPGFEKGKSLAPEYAATLGL